MAKKKAKKYCGFACRIYDTETCCGVLEIGSFVKRTASRFGGSEGDLHEDLADSLSFGGMAKLVFTGKSEESLEKQLKDFFGGEYTNNVGNIGDAGDARFTMFWFASPDGGEDWGAGTILRNALQQLPNVRSVGSGVNPNTGNTIEGFILEHSSDE